MTESVESAHDQIAFQQGRRAFLCGEDRDRNQYIPGAFNEAWDAGWSKACEEFKAGKVYRSASDGGGYYDSHNRAYGTGLGPLAHAEAQESGRYQRHEQQGRKEHIITRGGKPV